MKKLFLIPARGGSKGLPGKNIIDLSDKPLIQYSLEAAHSVASKGDEICVSTDSIKIKQIVEDLGYHVPFLRPAEYATDTATSEEVIKHALSWYEEHSLEFQVVVLLQPTSPLRRPIDIEQCLSLFDNDTEMVVAVKLAEDNPYYVMRVENESGYIEPLFSGTITRRQDARQVYTINGAVYVINVKALSGKSISHFRKVKKSVMPQGNSIDIDDMRDLKFAEYILRMTNEND